MHYSSIVTDLCVHNNVITNTSNDTDTTNLKKESKTSRQDKQNIQIKVVTSKQLLQKQKQDATFFGR